MPTLIVDANVMVSAILGRSLPALLSAFERGVAIAAPVQQLAETHATVEANQAKALPGWRDRLSDLMALVEPLGIGRFAAHEKQARERLDEGGQSDWPILAAALALDGDIWSHDDDFFGVGVPVWSTRNIRFAKGKMTS